MKIVIIAEGQTEKAFKAKLLEFLRPRVAEMPKIDFHNSKGRVPKKEILKRDVNRLLKEVDHVIALTDVYTGTHDFKDAADAKAKMREWAQADNSRFHPHAAQYEFEAWLIPYWATIQKLAKHKKGAPQGLPETINHGKPPSDYIEEMFEAGECKQSYSKWRDGMAILKDADLMIAINQCPELKSFINTILSICGSDVIP